MELIDVESNTSVTAIICDQLVHLHVDETTRDYATFTTKNKDGEHEHWIACSHQETGTIFVILDSVGDEGVNKKDGLKFTKMAGYAYCSFGFKDIAVNDIEAVDDILVAIEIAVETMQDDIKLKTLVKDINSINV